MELQVRIDEAIGLTLRPMQRDWPDGDSIVLQEACGKLSCGLSPETDRKRVIAWLEHLVPENGHYTEFVRRASKRMRRSGYGGDVDNVGQALWGNAQCEFTGKVALEAYDRKGNRVQAEEYSEYLPISDEEVGLIVAAAGRIAERGRMPPEVKTKLREHGLSGNRGKVCLRWNWQNGGWMVPGGNALSSHILKEESSREWLPAEAAIESYCQRALGLAGVETATTHGRLYRGFATVVSERTDRVDRRDGSPLQRTHQEEWSQAIRIRAYEKNDDDQPETDWRSLFRLLGAYGQEPEREQHKLARAIAALVLIGNADTHRRNVGIQHVWGAEGQKVVLAPLYDCSSVEGTELTGTKRMVVPIGGETEFDRVTAVHWRRLAESGAVTTALVLDAVRESAERLPDALREAAANAQELDATKEHGAQTTRIDAIEKHTVQRCKRTLDELGTRESVKEGQKALKPRPRPPWPQRPGKVD